MGELIDLAQRRELVDFIRRLATEIAAECADDVS